MKSSFFYHLIPSQVFLNKSDHSFNWLLSWTLIVFEQLLLHNSSECSHIKSSTSETTVRKCFFKIGVLSNFVIITAKHLCCCVGVKLQAWRTENLLKETPAQVFSREFCEIAKNKFFYWTPPVASSDALSVWHTHFLNWKRKAILGKFHTLYLIYKYAFDTSCSKVFSKNIYLPCWK